MFINPSIKSLEYLCDIFPDRVELYTFDYAKNFTSNPEESIKNYLEVVQFLNKLMPTIELNAGHDLNLQNLDFFLKNIKTIKEVSIGHALICDSFEYGLKNTIKKYLSITKIITTYDIFYLDSICISLFIRCYVSWTKFGFNYK